MVFLRARCCDYDGRYWKQPLIDMLAELPNSWTIINGAVSNQNDPSGWEEEIFRKNGGTHDWGTVAVIYNLKHDAWVALLLKTLTPATFEASVVFADPALSLYGAFWPRSVCDKMAGRTPGQVIEAAKEPCAPADMLLCLPTFSATPQHSFVSLACAL